MQGFELQKDRRNRRAELRRARAHLTDRDLYYDLDDLAAQFRAQLDVSPRVGAPLRALAHGLNTMGFNVADIAQVVGVTGAQIEGALGGKLRLDPAAAAAVERQVEEEIPETPEPGRFVRPQV